MIAPRHEVARLQSDFYRQQFHRMLRWTMYALAFIFILICLIVYQILVEPSPSYYANTSEGKILPMPAVKR